jgi:CheY-like chemotaxis protein
VNAIRKVLVVDDDPAVSKSFDQMLARKNCLVVSAGNGQEALNKLAHQDYDAVFIDIMMPGMDGIEVAERIRATHKSTPVVIITGYGSAEHQARAQAAGVRGFLCKPLSPELIETSLDAALATALLPAPHMLLQGAGRAALEPGRTSLIAPQPAAVGETGAHRSAAQVVKDIALFFAAPFITMGSLALFPFIGLAMLAKTWHHRKEAG